MAKAVRLTLETRETVLAACVDLARSDGLETPRLETWLRILAKRYATPRAVAVAEIERRLLQGGLLAPDDTCAGCGQALGDDTQARREGWHYECGRLADAEADYQRAKDRRESLAADEALDAWRGLE